MATDLTRPEALPGLDLRWSKNLDVVDVDGVKRRWHYLDNIDVLAEQERTPVGTIFCVHGNPTWSYLWRRLIAEASDADQPWRVVAVDQLEMGYSERTGRFRRMGERIDDLGRFTHTLGLTGPVVSIGHDWGGALSLGWAAAHKDLLVGSVVTNTAIDQPKDSALPFLIGLASLPGVHWLANKGTRTFVHATMATGRPRPPKEIRAAYLRPYDTIRRRKGIGDFVADIPLTEHDPSWPARQGLVAAMENLRDVPVLILWGTRDPVFTEVHFRYLVDNLPHATVHRFEKSGHLVVEEAEVGPAVMAWLSTLSPAPLEQAAGIGSPEPATGTSALEQAGGVVRSAPAAATTLPQLPEPRRPLWRALEEKADDDTTAVVELDESDPPVTTSWRELAARWRNVAAGLVDAGVKPGDRVAMLVTPGPDLTAGLYACMRIGAPAVVVDAGLGVQGMHRALRASNPDWLIGIDRSLVPSRLLGWAPRRFSAGLSGTKGSVITRLSGAEATLDELAARGQGRSLPPEPDADDVAAVVFTTGSTGPAKGVVYRYRQMEAARDALMSTYPTNRGDAWVAAFAPFALFGPSLGVTSAVPAMDVTAPKTLTAAALADAVAAVDARGIFASPAAVANVVKTASDLRPDQREAMSGVQLMLSAGAPVSVPMLRELRQVLPNAVAHTPYGMTEVLPVTDVTLAELEAAGSGNGVMVGRPVEVATVRIAPLDAHGRPADELTDQPGVTGEILIRADHVKDHYDQLWWTERTARVDGSWHRSGDVGHFDNQGQLWVEGRLRHVITGPDGVITPVGVEQRVESLDEVVRAAVLGVGPAGVQQVVTVVETEPPADGQEPASAELAAAIRQVAGVPVAAVFVVPELPTDIRHNAKVKRELVAAWAERKLAGGRGGRWGSLT